MFKPRPYQEKPLESALSVMNVTGKVNKSLLVQPTGAGKSWVIANTAYEINEPMLIIQPSKELLIQNYTKFVQLGGEASIVCSSAKVKQKNKIDYTLIDDQYVPCDMVSKVTYTTVGSAMKYFDKFKSLGVRRIIVDEAHHMTQSGTRFEKFSKDLKVKNLLGLTATPILLKTTSEGSQLRMMNRTSYSLFRDICYVTQIQELVEQNYWTKLIYKGYKVDTSPLVLNSSGADYDEASQSSFFEKNRLDKNIKYTVETLQKEGRKSILVFVPSIKEALKLFSIIPNSAVVHSGMDIATRDYVVKAFRDGDIPVVINVNILATGFDHPEVDAIITARPTKSIAVFYQQCGRGVRISPNKDNCIIVDFSGNLKTFGKLEGIKYLNVEDEGWGMYNSSGKLLTGVNMDGTESRYSIDLSKRNKKVVEGVNYRNSSIIFWFGKYEGLTVKEVIRKDSRYIKWLYEDFNFGDGKLAALKEELELYITDKNKPENRF
ncbi:MAG: DEAD/DEAH box helicase family protein [Candidatus Riesia sp.]|nr:DEAD/DEAH box helicase family protein [Candidatus Riesia sp.]